MVNSVGNNLIDIYIQRLNPDKDKNTENNTIINTDNYSKNLIERYLENSGYYNRPLLSEYNTVTRTPSEIDNYENYFETDKHGNAIASITHSKDGDTLIQELKTKSPDGTILNKTVKNSENLKSSKIIIYDKNGEILLSKEKSYQKIDDDCARTVINGEIYNISGLKGDILNVEHNGERITLDLNQMLISDVKMLEMRHSPDTYPIRENKISEEEKTLLFNRIKSLSGDELFNLSKSVKHIQFLDNTPIDAHFCDDGQTLLLSRKDWGTSNLITEHELGHAINHSLLNGLKSDNNDFIKTRNYEKTNYLNSPNKSKGDKFFESKFLTGNSDLNWEETNNAQGELERTLRDETFAEGYNNLNCLDIIHYDDDTLPNRMLSILKYMPKTLVEIDKQ